MAHRWQSLVVLIAVAACGEPGGPDWTDDAACSGRPRSTHSGTTNGPVRLTAAGSPHLLTASMRVNGALHASAGALICAAPDAHLEAASFHIAGTPDAPVVFRSVDATRPWGGLTTTGIYEDPVPAAPSVLAHTVIEDAHHGFASVNSVVQFDHVIVRRTTGTAIAVRRGDVRDTRAEDACRESSDCSAILLGQYAGVRLERVHVENSGGTGISTLRRSHHVFRDVRIIGSRGVGLYLLPWDDGDFGGYSFEGSIRITGGGSIPAHVRLPVAERILALAGAADSLSGNAIDMIHVNAAYARHVVLRLTAPLAWRLGSSLWQPTASVQLDVEMEAGSRLELTGSRFAATIRASGTAHDPVHIDGGVRLRLAGEAGDTSRISHARLRHLALDAAPDHVVQLDHIVADSSAIILRAPGSHLADAVLRGGVGSLPGETTPPDGPLTLGPGTRAERVVVHASPRSAIRIDGDNVLIDGCDVTGAAGDGIRVTSGANVAVRDCNVHGNAGFAVNNLGPHSVDARHNWWGSADGPADDELQGDVLFTPFLGAPVVLENRSAGARAPTALMPLRTADATAAKRGAVSSATSPAFER